MKRSLQKSYLFSVPNKKRQKMSSSLFKFDELLWTHIYKFCSQDYSFSLINRTTYSIFLRNLQVDMTHIYKCIFRHYHASIHFLLNYYYKERPLNFVSCLYCAAINNRNSYALKELISSNMTRPNTLCKCVHNAANAKDDIYIRLLMESNVLVRQYDINPIDIAKNGNIAVSKFIATHEIYGPIFVLPLIKNSINYCSPMLDILLDTPYVTDAMIKIAYECACANGELESVKIMVSKQRVLNLIDKNHSIIRKIISLIDNNINDFDHELHSINITNIEKIILFLMEKKHY